MTAKICAGRIIDLMVGVPGDSEDHEFLRPLMRTAPATDLGAAPVKHLFRDAPVVPPGVDSGAFLMETMDRYGVARALIDVTRAGGAGARLVRERPDRFLGGMSVDPNTGMEGVRALCAAYAAGGVVAVTGSPTAFSPQIPINDKRYYPIYAKCVELGLPIFLTVGMPGPRIPMAAQHVELIDEVCWFFPELKFVMRHGAEPWVDLAVKLMLKWPNLYYSTSAFAPKRYPQAIIDFANSRGRDRVMFAGYFPVGLTYERIFSDFEALDLKSEVWPAFLYGNAERVLGLRATESPP